MTPTEYLDILSTSDSSLLLLVLSEEITIALRLGETTEPEDAAVKWVDDIIANAPPTTKPLALYKGYTGISGLDKGGDVVDKAFLSASIHKPTDTKGTVTLAINVPPGTPALALPGGTYVLGRGQKLNVKL